MSYYPAQEILLFAEKEVKYWSKIRPAGVPPVAVQMYAEEVIRLSAELQQCREAGNSPDSPKVDSHAAEAQE